MDLDGLVLDPDPEAVSEEAGQLYAHLQVLIESHGPGCVEGLLPVLVSLLESLAQSRTRLSERENESEREREERETLLEQFERERSRRRETEERFLELDDALEQERRALQGKVRAAETRSRDMERKAREYADQMAALEEQRANQSRELSALRHTHTKLLRSYKEMLDQITASSNPPRAQKRSLGSEVEADQGYPKSISTPQAGLTEEEELIDKEEERQEVKEPSPVDDIINATPELAHVDDINSTPELAHVDDIISSTPELAHVDDIINSTPELTHVDDIMTTSSPLPQEHAALRNTDSVFTELSGISTSDIDDVDMGASLHVMGGQFESLISDNEELKRDNLVLDAARRALISRVEELTNERATLGLEAESLRDTATRLEGRLKDSEEEVRRLRQELEEAQKSDPESSLPPALRRRFSRLEMARVVMERNQFKERLIELQEALRRTQDMRATKEERNVEEKRSSVWRKFHRLFGLTKDPLAPSPVASHRQTPPPVASHRQTPPLTVGEPKDLNRLYAANRNTRDSGSVDSSDVPPPLCLSPRDRKCELYREIRSHVWSMLGKQQVHGWSLPPTTDTQVAVLMQSVPALVQLRILDQRDPSSKLCCAVAVTPDNSGAKTSSVWLFSGTPSCSDVTVLDPSRSNHVLDQFSLPGGARVLCAATIPPAVLSSGSVAPSPGTVWIGTQQGSIFLHSAVTDRGHCVQSVRLQEGVHSITYAQGHVIAGLANGTLLIFCRDSVAGWDLLSPRTLALAPPPLQPIRCSLAVGAELWCGYWNRIYIIDAEKGVVELSFQVSPRPEQQVRFLCGTGSGVWVSCRLDSVLRLYETPSHRLTQELEIESLVCATLGPSLSTLFPFQVSSLALLCGRLWVGTGSGAVFSLPLRQEPLSDTNSQTSAIPYCCLPGAQLCYHGHRDAVRFFISVPGCVNPSLAVEGVQTELVMSGGEGYINFRIGDGEEGTADAMLRRAERSHMIIWQSHAHL
ncbi:C-Jun-amino-terminal kinase-interacting protein 4 isoform X2 [Acipenser ruthenus]|uniref:C-Jun-amino-terminal kinase-interacting protein 4 isoform X2 n=1 Tax=Acipenser ruthenus TaxID=7906 RepID=UPI0027403807|nr:C-Jun-amino-terminal kinase-interacting protein 4 isoform X2 [Acipenser ruthenus]